MKYLLIYFIFLFQTACFAQNYSIDLSGKFLYTTQLSSGSYSSRQFIPTREINSVDVIRLGKKLTNTYNSNFGYEVLSRVKFRIGKRFRFSAGLGLNYLRFKVNTTNEIRIDAYSTSVSNNSEPNLFFNTLCEGFYHFNSSTQNEVRLDGTFRILSAKSPVQLAYSFFDGKLELGIGFFLQIPIYSMSINQFTSLNYNEINGDLTCESSNHKESEDNIKDLNKTQAGYSFNISYKLCERIFVDIGLENYFVGYFDSYEAFLNLHDRYTPTSLYVGLGLKL